MSTMLQNLLKTCESIGDHDDEGGSVIVGVIRPPTKFDKICDDLGGLIQKWKTKEVPITQEDCDGALQIIEIIKQKHASLQTLASTMSSEILALKGTITNEINNRIISEKKMNEDIQRLNATITQMTATIEKLTATVDGQEKRRKEIENIMIIRAMGTSFQYALTQKFPKVFTSKYAYACTLPDIQARLAKYENPDYQRIIDEVIAVFTNNGCLEEDIPDLIKVIRELGTENSHLTKVKDADGKERPLSYEDIEEAISNATLAEDRKQEAHTLLKALRHVVPPGGALLYCK